MAKYKKRPDGRYMVNIYSHTDPETGIRKYVSVYARSIPKLEAKAAEVRDQLNKGTYADDKGYTVGTWSKEWLETEKANCRMKTKEMYHRAVNSYIIPALGDVKLKDLKKIDIQKLINSISDRPRTCVQVHMTIRQILDCAMDNNLVFKNVCHKITLPSAKAPEKRALTDDEKKAIKKADFTDKEKAFVYIIQYTGMRRGEVLALSRNDIDFKDNLIHVRNTIIFDGTAAVFQPFPKSDAGIRDLPMPNILRAYLREYTASLAGLYLFEMERKSGFMTKSSYDKFWKHIVQKINLTAGGTETLQVIHGLTAHIFRHNYATMLFYSGVDEKEAQKLLGHSDIKLTLNIYTHLDNKHLGAVAKLNTFLKNSN